MAGLNGLVIVNGGHVNFVDTDMTTKATVVPVVQSSALVVASPSTIREEGTPLDRDSPIE